MGEGTVKLLLSNLHTGQNHLAGLKRSGLSSTEKETSFDVSTSTPYSTLTISNVDPQTHAIDIVVQ